MPDPHTPDQPAAGPAGLEPCPFCGGEAYEMVDRKSGAWAVVCRNRYVCGAAALGRDAWNRRAPVPPPASETALVEALEPFADAFAINAVDGNCLSEADWRAIREAVSIQDFRRAATVLAAHHAQQEKGA